MHDHEILYNSASSIYARGSRHQTKYYPKKEATKEEKFKLENARKITESLQKHLLEDDEEKRKRLKMSSESDFEEIDIERFQKELKNDENFRERADSFTGKQQFSGFIEKN